MTARLGRARSSLGLRVRVAADQRGVALQTVIIMVVLIVIAGGVAAALLGRSADVVDDLETQQIGPQAESYPSRGLCETAGHNWKATPAPGKCTAEAASSYTTQSTCEADGHTWQPAVADDPDTLTEDESAPAKCV